MRIVVVVINVFMILIFYSIYIGVMCGVVNKILSDIPGGFHNCC